MAGIALAILAIFAIVIIRNSPWWLGADADAYYLAAERLRNGEPLYVDTPGSHEGSYYRYAPWFAFAWIPLTFLPQNVAVGAFALVSLSLCIPVLWPLVRSPSLESVAMLLLVGPALVHFSFMGNAHTALLAAVVYLPGRPIWIAVATSLKFTPLALILPDIAVGRWRRTAVCVGLAAVLTLPIFAFDLSGFVTDPQRQVGTWGVSPFLTLGMGAAASVATLLIARRDYRLGLGAAAAAVVLGSPYLIVAYLSWLVVPLRGPEVPDEAPTGVPYNSRHRGRSV